MNNLFACPEFKVTFWSWKKTVKFVGKKAAFPPLGLLTIAAMMPTLWSKKLVDLNVCKLKDKDIMRADFVFVSAMSTQKDSAEEVIARCKKFGKPVGLGGPILEMGCDKFPDVDYFFLGEAEETFPEFLKDLKNNNPKKIYSADLFPDITLSPVPLFKMANHRHYASALIGFCRGCPFICDFCNVEKINGRTPRPKSVCQFLVEVYALYEAGFRGPVMIADDNFAGNVAATKKVLQEIALWQKEHKYPFDFTAEVPITIADDPELMRLMTQAGFRKIFLGIETPNKDSLLECRKFQNAKRDLAECVKIIQSHGLAPMSGFIVGFDSDNPETFDQEMIDFIQKSGIVMAMVGVLQAIPGTATHAKLWQEGRLIDLPSGNNTDCYPNFAPKMPVEKLVAGYKKIVQTIYSPKKYYERICNFLDNYEPTRRSNKRINMVDFKAFTRANIWIGLLGGPEVSYYYWKSLAKTLFSKKWRALPDVVAFQIYGVHFMEIAKGIGN